MTIKYKNQWKSLSVNEEFWKEVLVGRTITDIVLTGRGVVALKLDNGENIRFTKESTIYIQQDVEPEKEKSDDKNLDDEDIDDIIEKEPNAIFEDNISLDYFINKYFNTPVSKVTSDNIKCDLKRLDDRNLADKTSKYHEQRKYLSNLLFELHSKLKT